MEPYNFWQDFFDTYQSLSDGMKALWLIVPPAFALALSALAMRFSVRRRRVGRSFDGELIYSILRDDKGQLHVIRHGPHIANHPNMLLLDPRSRDPAELTRK